MIDPHTKKNRQGTSPTSFTLDADLLYRFKNACSRRETTQTKVVADAIERWLSLSDSEFQRQIADFSAHLKDSRAGHASAQLASTDSREATVNKHGQRVITVVESKESTASAAIEITPGEWTWVIRFLNIMRSGTIAARAIKWNILTFSKVIGGQGDAKDSPIPRPQLSPKDLERIRREARTVEQALESEDEDGTKHQAAGARRGGTQG